MADGAEPKIAGSHVAELGRFFNAHDQWLFGHACVRTNGDRELAADLVQDTFEAAARAWAALREHDTGRQRAWLLATVANKNVSEFRRTEAFHRRQSDIHARYQPTAADTEATVHAHLHAARITLTAGLEQYYPFAKDDKDDRNPNDDSGRGAAS
jgi:DNA-directed RNA polymerase specialized sigma24 family protein